MRKNDEFIQINENRKKWSSLNEQHKNYKKNELVSKWKIPLYGFNKTRKIGYITYKLFFQKTKENYKRNEMSRTKNFNVQNRDRETLIFKYVKISSIS